MHANVGDRLRIHGKIVGIDQHEGEIIEIHSQDGTPPYLVRFPDGHERLMFPGPDCIVAPRKATG